MEEAEENKPVKRKKMTKGDETGDETAQTVTKTRARKEKKPKP